MTLVDQARKAVRDAEFIVAWPKEVKDVFVRALKTDGDLPPYAHKQVTWAMREARRIETKMSRDIIQGEALLPQKLKKQLVRA